MHLQRRSWRLAAPRSSASTNPAPEHRHIHPVDPGAGMIFAQRAFARIQVSFSLPAPHSPQTRTLLTFYNTSCGAGALLLEVCHLAVRHRLIPCLPCIAANRGDVPRWRKRKTLIVHERTIGPGDRWMVTITKYEKNRPEIISMMTNQPIGRVDSEEGIAGGMSLDFPHGEPHELSQHPG